MSYLLALFFFLLPTYLVRFRIGSFPTTLLEILFWIICAVWIIQKPNISYLVSLIKQQRTLFLAITLFLTAATISIFTSLDIRAALGVWKTFYVEPVILFFILISTIKTQKQINLILSALLLSGLITSLLAIYQRYTGWLVPHAFWENHDTYRVTAWYGFPNAVGLFLAPLVPLALYRWRVGLFTIPFFILAILFAKSMGGLIGVAVGIGILLLIHKKTRLPTVILGTVLLITLFSLPKQNAIRQELFMQDRSGQIRIAMWGEAGQLLSDRPILGAGLASYAARVELYHGTVNGEGVEIFHHPHNIFLTMWVNLGLIGLAGFICILVWFYRIALQDTINANHYMRNIYFTASMTTLLVTGLVDSPYIKNDLAMFFWLLPALLFISEKKATATAL